MSENQRQGVTRRNAVKREADIGMADATTRNLHDNLISTRGQSRKLAGLQSRARGCQLKSVSSPYTRHSGRLRLIALKPATIWNLLS